MNEGQKNPRSYSSRFWLLGSLAAIGLSFSLVMLCPGRDVTVSIKDQQSGAPAGGIRVVRMRPVSLVRKIFNPVGAAYFPDDFVGALVTDQNGRVVFANSKTKDWYIVYFDNPRAVTFSLDNLHVDVSPKDGKVSGSSWGCDIHLSDGQLNKEVGDAPAKDKRY